MIRPKTNHSSTRAQPLNELRQRVEAAGAISRLGNTRDKAAKQDFADHTNKECRKCRNVAESPTPAH